MPSNRTLVVGIESHSDPIGWELEFPTGRNASSRFGIQLQERLGLVSKATLDLHQRSLAPSKSHYQGPSGDTGGERLEHARPALNQSY